MSESYHHETGRTPETIAKALAERIERGLAELHIPPRSERGFGWCNFVPDAVNYCALQDGEQNDYAVGVAKYQARSFHEQAAGITREDAGYREFFARTISHGFSIVQIGGQPFLMDFTFAQFMGENGFIGRAATNEWTNEPVTNPLAQTLLHTGFVPLTDQTLREYVRLTTLEENPPYLDGVNLGMLEHIRPLPFDVGDNELMGDIPPAYQNLDK